jgi:hypothetical protein
MPYLWAEIRAGVNPGGATNWPRSLTLGTGATLPGPLIKALGIFLNLTGGLLSSAALLTTILNLCLTAILRGCRRQGLNRRWELFSVGDAPANGQLML